MKTIFAARDVSGAIAKMAEWLLGLPSSQLAIVGIRRGGEYVAKRVNEIIRLKGIDVPLGFLDITFWRDDLMRLDYNPQVRRTHLDFSLDGKIVILIDDVIFTGRTVRAALSEIMDFGRPDEVRLAVLVDRGHRELPIQPDFISFKVETSKEQMVEVLLKEKGYPEDRIVVVERGEKV
jgi:pyrimidine operon attenuation protein/uracil phosphoribosyltransferase